MRRLPICFRQMSFVCCILGVTLTGCVGFDPAPQSTVEDLQERPFVAILPFGFDLDITRLSAIKTVEGSLSPEDEVTQIAQALWEIQQEARWLLLSRLATGYGFLFVPLEQTDALANLATAWNPALLLANVGVDVLTNSAIFFGGGYLFGIVLRPVRVEARAFETVQGYPIWQMMDASVFAWSALKMLPEEVRAKKEAQLALNLAEIMESLGDALTEQAFTTSRLRGEPQNAQQ